MSKNPDTAFFGHPKGLKTLFFTEMWERFSYYGMRAFLVLFMVAPTDKGGLGLEAAKAGLIYGMYTSCVYLMSVPGGWIADRFLGLRRAVALGGVLIMSGHIVLAIPFDQSFYVGLALVVLGTGLLKPNISAIVGQLYGAEDKRRDSGYSIYYMGINIGAFTAPLVCGFLAQSATVRNGLQDAGLDPGLGWHLGFGAAAVGMGFGVIQFLLGSRHLGEAGAKPAPAKSPAEASRNKLMLVAVLAAVVLTPVLLGGLDAGGVLPMEKAFGFSLILLTVSLFTGLFVKGCENSGERRRLAAIVVLFIGAVMFWACFEQAGSTLNLFAANHSRNSLLGFDFPSTWFQSVNSIFVISMAPVFAFLWLFLANRKIEPTSVAKFGASLVLVGLGFAVMLVPAMTLDGGTVPLGSGVTEASLGKVSPGWLVGLYFVHTCAELCLSPVGLSSMSKLAPARWGGLVMGIWFLAASVGNFLAGYAVSYTTTPTFFAFFSAMVIAPVVLALVFFTLVKPIRRMLEHKDNALPEARVVGE